jgi:hypothetical protein
MVARPQVQAKRSAQPLDHHKNHQTRKGRQIRACRVSVGPPGLQLLLLEPEPARFALASGYPIPRLRRSAHHKHHMRLRRSGTDLPRPCGASLVVHQTPLCRQTILFG